MRRPQPQSPGRDGEGCGCRQALQRRRRLRFGNRGTHLWCRFGDCRRRFERRPRILFNIAGFYRRQATDSKFDGSHLFLDEAGASPSRCDIAQYPHPVASFGRCRREILGLDLVRLRSGLHRTIRLRDQRPVVRGFGPFRLNNDPLAFLDRCGSLNDFGRRRYRSLGWQNHFRLCLACRQRGRASNDIAVARDIRRGLNQRNSTGGSVLSWPPKDEGKSLAGIALWGVNASRAYRAICSHCRGSLRLRKKSTAKRSISGQL